jgi:hypothetical protein
MTPTTAIRLGVQLTFIALLNIPLLFILFLGWSFYSVYSALCFGLGILSVLAWAAPVFQRMIFVAGVPPSRIKRRLAFSVIFNFSAAATFHYLPAHNALQPTGIAS